MTWLDRYRALVSGRLREIFEPLQAPVYELCAYHLGWTDEDGRPLAGQAGKMLRPVLCLAACSGYGDAELAVNCGAALELLHAFSLAHDDIEDGDRERRHRPTLWALHGVPLALNAGDALYALAVATLHSATALLPQERRHDALDLFSATCLRLVEGQHLDLEFETRDEIEMDDYLDMARGKTGALLGTSAALGALCGGAPPAAVGALRRAGSELGLAFQARDDMLAFWGDPAQTGKAAGNDLARSKKSLPLLLARARGFSGGQDESLPAVLAAMDRLGIREELEQFVAGHAGQALSIVDTLAMADEGRRRLRALVEFATERES